MSTDREWLDSLQPGDEVYVPGNYGSIGHIEIVVKRTKTQIVTNRFDNRYRISDGKRLGTSGYNIVWIRPVTQEVRDKLYEHVLRYKVIKAFEEHRKTAPQETLEKLLAVLKEYENEQSKRD